MADLLTVIVHALEAYWLSPFPATVLAVCAASMGTLLYVFVTNSRNAKLRVSLLTGLYALSIFFWAFIAVSFVLCLSQARMVAYVKNGVPLAVFGSVIGGLGASVLISGIVWRFGNAAILRRFAARDPGPHESWLADKVRTIADFEGVPNLGTGVVEDDSPLAMAVGGRRPTILVSTGLLRLLERDQLETVVAHEVMHLKHHDAEFKVFSRVLSRILFFDPFSKFFDPAIHREREYLADETSGRLTGRPASLASALLKISDRGMPAKSMWGLSILGPGDGIFRRYPPLKERVRRLITLSEMLESREMRIRGS